MRFLKMLLLTAVAALSLQAAPVLTLSPSGDLLGLPGQEVTWNFTITADPNEWVSFIASLTSNESNPTLGFYTDQIGAVGGPVSGVLAPGAPAWNGQFGFYSISPLAAVNDFNSGTLLLLYETFSADPNTCGSCLTGDGLIETPFSVTVSSDVPEPGTWISVIAGLALIAGARLGRRAS